MFNVKSKAEQICLQILKPKKSEYRLTDLGLICVYSGAPCFNNDGVDVNRHEIEIASSNGKFMHTSFFDTGSNERRETCVIYLHSISGTRLEAMPAMRETTKLGFSFACFDFLGCGYSEGEMVTLGVREKEDLRQVIKYLRASQNIKNFILWGKSMGAVTALLYACKYNDVAGVIADSAFSNLDQLILEMAQHHVGLPDFILKIVRNYLSSIIQDMIHIETKEIDVLGKISKLKSPILYVASPEDDLVSINHSRLMFKYTNSPKRFLEISGSHNSLRSHAYYMRVSQIILNILNNGTPKETASENESIASHNSTIDSLNIRSSNDSEKGIFNRARNLSDYRPRYSYSPNNEKNLAYVNREQIYSTGNELNLSNATYTNTNNLMNFNTENQSGMANKIKGYSEYDSLHSFHSNMKVAESNRKTTFDFENYKDPDSFNSLRTRVIPNGHQNDNGALITIKGISRLSRNMNPAFN